MIRLRLNILPWRTLLQLFATIIRALRLYAQGITHQLPLPTMRPSIRHCAVRGCAKPVARRADGREHETCGKFHHNILMSERTGAALGYEDAFDDMKTCPVAGCNKKRFAGKDCCSKEHALLFMREVFQKISDRKCKLPECYKHVYVETKGDGSLRIHDFCCWSHRKDFDIGCNQAVVQEISDELLVEALKRWVLQEQCSSMDIDESFFTKHPWEVLPPGTKSRYMIVKCNYKDKSCIQRDMTTKDNFHWKQGKKEDLTIGGNMVTKQYLTYVNMSLKIKSPDEGKESCTYTMIEYNLQESNRDGDLKPSRWCMVKVICGRQIAGSLGGDKGNRKQLKIDEGVTSSSLDPRSTKERKQVVDRRLELDSYGTIGRRTEISGSYEEKVPVEGFPHRRSNHLEDEMLADWFTDFY